MEITDKTINQLSNLNLESEDEEEIEVIYVENLTGSEIVDFARYGELQIMEELLRLDLLHKLKEAVDERGNTALHMASANGHREVVEFILMAVAADTTFVNKKNEKGNTALHWACLNGHSAVAELLLAHGADHTITNDIGRLAFDEALQQNHEAIMTLIADKAAIEPAEESNIEAE